MLALCNFSHPVMEELRDAGMTVCPFNIRARFNLPGYKEDSGCLLRYKEYRANLVHCHGFKAGVIGRLGLCCRMSGYIPCIISFAYDTAGQAMDV